MSTSTLTPVGERIWRINNPAVCGALTRSGGFPSPKLLGRIYRATGIDSLDYSEIEFRRGLNTNCWYVAIFGDSLRAK